MTSRRYIGIAITAALILWASATAWAQATPSKADYVAVVQQFYARLFATKAPGTAKCARLFGNDFYKTEERAFREICRQNRIDSEACTEQMKDYYAHKDTASVYFLKIKEQQTELTQDLAREEVRQVVNTSTRMLDFGDQGGVMLRVQFHNQRYIHFALKQQPDDSIVISNVYLSDGASVSNRAFERLNDYLLLPGTIHDPEGYVYVRNLPDDNSLIAGKITEGDVFFYTPDCDNRWWKVRMQGRNEVEGYIRSGSIYMRPKN